MVLGVIGPFGWLVEVGQDSVGSGLCQFLIFMELLSGVLGIFASCLDYSSTYHIRPKGRFFSNDKKGFRQMPLISHQVLSCY